MHRFGSTWKWQDNIEYAYETDISGKRQRSLNFLVVNEWNGKIIIFALQIACDVSTARRQNMCEL